MTLQNLQDELARALEMIKHFNDQPGVMNGAAIARLALRAGANEKVTVTVKEQRPNGAFYRGVIVGVNSCGERFDVIADDGELVPGVPCRNFIQVNLVEK